MSSNIVSVSQLTNAISLALEEGIGYVFVRGEISNYKAHSSGHRYFTLKDDYAQISCTLWRGKYISFQPADGMKVVVEGKITVYPPRGQYQIECDKISPLGKGELFLAFEALKQKLSELGYFDQSRKKSLPQLPLKIGIATSETGAAVRDMLSTISRRLPLITVYFRNTAVQGEAAAEDIAEAIEQLNKTDAELIIIGRGGGSIEDLWPFNTEITANAVINSRLPIISAVGHETDFTIVDFCADVRAATPTAAAELVTKITILELQEIIEQQGLLMSKYLKDDIEAYRDIIVNASSSYSFRRVHDRLNILKQTIDESESRLNNNFSRGLTAKRQTIEWLHGKCASLHPLSPLKKSFALLYSQNRLIENNCSLRDIKDIEILRLNEKASATVYKTEKLSKIQGLNNE